MEMKYLYTKLVINGITKKYYFPFSASVDEESARKTLDMALPLFIKNEEEKANNIIKIRHEVDKRIKELFG
jgi:hypothetical protein